MKLFFAAGASLVVFFIIVQSSSGTQLESETGVVPNKTDAFGLVHFPIFCFFLLVRIVFVLISLLIDGTSQ